MTVVQRSVRLQKILQICLIVFLVLFNIFFCVAEGRKYARWQNMAENWTECPAVLLKHEQRSTGSGKNRTTVSLVEYRYEYKGKVCTGTKIGIGLSCLPESYKPGMKVRCLVNPANGESALYYSNGLLGIFIVTAVTLAAAVLGVFQVFRLSKIDVNTVPEEFTAYCAAQKQEIGSVELKPNRKFFAIQVKSALDTENPRFLVYHTNRMIWQKVLGVCLLVVFGVGPLLFQEYSTMPGVLFAALWLYFCCRQKSVVFDVANKCIRFEFERHLKELDLRPVNPARVIPFDDVKLMVFSGLNRAFFHLEIVNTKKNVVIRKRNMQELMREAVILANAMGGVSIADIAHSEYVPGRKKRS